MGQAEIAFDSVGRLTQALPGKAFCLTPRRLGSLRSRYLLRHMLIETSKSEFGAINRLLLPFEDEGHKYHCIWLGIKILYQVQVLRSGSEIFPTSPHHTDTGIK